MGAEAAGMGMQMMGMVGEGVGAYQGMEESTRQAKKLIQESEVEAQAQKREDDRFLANQESQYWKSGVTLEGSPLLVLEETRQQGLQSRQNIRSSARAQAETLVRAGKQRLMGALLFPTGAKGMAQSMPVSGGAPRSAAPPSVGSGGDRQSTGGGQYMTNQGY
jgi:hypothetical protein